METIFFTSFVKYSQSKITNYSDRNLQLCRFPFGFGQLSRPSQRRFLVQNLRKNPNKNTLYFAFKKEEKQPDDLDIRHQFELKTKAPRLFLQSSHLKVTLTR